MPRTANPSQGPVVEVSSFRKAYGKTAAVLGVDLTVKRGEMYGLIGPDGAGKSTLMKALAGVLTYDAGLVSVFGLPVRTEKEAEAIKARIGFMPQGLGLNLYPELSIEENIDFFARLRLVPESDLKRRKARLLAMTRLDAFKDRAMKNLSGGMKQKLGLICSLIHEPDLIILDEPTTGVDPVSRRDFWAILASLLWERGMTALVSTAYMEEASRFHRISLMHGGRILASGSPPEISSLAPGVILSIRSDAGENILSALKNRYGHVQVMGNRYKVFMPGRTRETACDVFKAELKGIRILEWDCDAPDLEDVFLQLIGKETGRSSEEIVPNASAAPSAPAETMIENNTGQSTAISATGLIRDFDHFRAVDTVSFEVPYGEIFGLLGANGAGKTTVIKMLTGILQPTSGDGQVAGADMRTAGREIKERIGYMSQAFSLYTDLSVVENIRLYAGIYGLDRKAEKNRTQWVLDMAELHGYEKRLTGSLPMGVRQRLALGCALVHRPKVLFLDEPTSGVDPMGRRRLWETFHRLSREENVAILVTTHYMSEAEHCDHLALMFAGRVVADASPDRMKQDVETEAGVLLEAETDNPLLSLQILEKERFEGVALFGGRIHFLTRDRDASEKKLASVLSAGRVRLLSVVPKKLSMEDVFVYRVLSLERDRKHD